MKILKALWRGWMRFAEFFGNFMSRFIMTVMYFTLFLPVGVIFRLFGDPLNIRRPSGSNWQPGAPRPGTLTEACQQF